MRRAWAVWVLIFVCAPVVLGEEAGAPRKRKIVLVAGVKSHGPEGNGVHDYPWSVRLIKAMLDHSNVSGLVDVEYHLNGWPKDESTLDSADTLVIISDGRDGDKYSEAPHLISDERVAFVDKQMKRGCGLVTFHFSTFAPNKYAESVLKWNGGFFQWETDGQRKWFSNIKEMEAPLTLDAPAHPASSGVQPFKLKEEFYYDIKFKADDKALTPLCSVPALPGRDASGRVVAWALERLDGGRGFGTTTGHYYKNWKDDNFRKLILNAIVWTAKVEVPKSGVEAKFYENDELKKMLPEFTEVPPRP